MRSIYQQTHTQPAPPVKVRIIEETNSTMSSTPFDDSSQTSRGSSLNGSLLARIQASREASLRTEEPLIIPNYSHVATRESSPQLLQSSSWNFFWPRFTNDSDVTESLLQDDAELGGENPQHYSMMRYFQTFILDVYTLFRSVHPVAQVVSVIVLLIIAFKLL